MMPCSEHKICTLHIVIDAVDQLFGRRKIFRYVIIQCFFNRYPINICVDLFFRCVMQTLRAHAIDNRVRSKQRRILITPTAITVIFCAATKHNTTSAACFFFTHLNGYCIDTSVLQTRCTCFLIAADNCGISNRHIVL